MANLKDIRRRIVGVQKTQQITSAMRMVAAAKLRRAESAIKAARPYAERMRATLAEVTGAATDVQHPLLERRDVEALELVVITSDRGLAGAFNANVIKRAQAAIDENADVERIDISTVGKKATEHFKRHHRDRLVESAEIGAGWIEYETASAIARRLARRYADGEIDRVVLAYAQFKSTMTQEPTASQLLPFSAEGDRADAGEGGGLPYSIEPSPEKLLGTLIPRALEVEIFRALLENQAGEHAARMTAMESATRNTEDLIESLSIQYNRARQAAITTELVEIVSGAEAL